jgi:collagenase-like PrtC family protease
MKLSVAYTFEPGLLARLAAFPEVYEVYGKLRNDPVGGGRSNYTLRHVSRATLEKTINEAHAHTIEFNYLINGATLGGLEQTRSGQRKIRALLDYLDAIGVNAVTISSPYLLKLVKKRYPRFKTRVSVFAVVDSPLKAKSWEDMGADTLCISSIACNRDFKKLAAIRNAVACDLQLIANANCLLSCAYELTHMDLLTRSSRAGDRLGGFCLDYCILHCSMARLADPLHLLRSVWIRPEDLTLYEGIGYTNFKIVERSCPGDLLVKRVKAYADRSFDGNLLELVGQVAQIKKEQGAGKIARLRMMLPFLKPHFARVSSLLKLKRYGEKIILHDYSREKAPVYIDNKSLNGFLDGMKNRACGATADCKACGYCSAWAEKVVTIDERYRDETLALGKELEQGLYSGEVWE